MSILEDNAIDILCQGDRPMIHPYLHSSVKEVTELKPHESLEDIVRRKVLSFGSSSYGYDVRLGREFKIFTNANSVLIDPKRFDARALVDAEIHLDVDGAEYVILPPNSYGLSVTHEYFRMPSDVMCVALGKSTYARASIGINVTPVEPGFEGNVVIEIANHCSLPVKVYLMEGIAQFLFFRGKPCRTSYADRDGKYQGQTGITLSRV